MVLSEADATAHPAVVARITALEAALTVALARIAELEVQFGAPRKTAANSSSPPSSCFKAERAARRRATTLEREPAAKRIPKAGHRGLSRSRLPRAQVPAAVVEQ